MHEILVYFNSCTVVHCMNELHLIYLFSIHGHLNCFLIFLIKICKGGIAGSQYVHIFNSTICEQFTLQSGVPIYRLTNSEKVPHSSHSLQYMVLSAVLTSANLISVTGYLSVAYVLLFFPSTPIFLHHITLTWTSRHLCLLLTLKEILPTFHHYICCQFSIDNSYHLRFSSQLVKRFYKIMNQCC